MTLRIFNDVAQGTEEWHDLRRGIITASVIGRFITPKTIKVAANGDTRAMAYQLVAERITGRTEDTYISRDMEIGHIVEPLARDLYSATYEPVEEVGFMIRTENEYRAGYSPDGAVGDDGLIEVKRHLPKLHLELILNNEIPSIHIAQCQMGLFISGRQWLDYLSYCGGMPMWRKRVTPHPVWFAAIEQVLTEFEKNAAQMIDTYTAATNGLPNTEYVDDYLDVELKL